MKQMVLTQQKDMVLRPPQLMPATVAPTSMMHDLILSRYLNIQRDTPEYWLSQNIINLIGLQLFKKDFPEQHIQTNLLTVIAMHSVKLGDPLILNTNKSSFAGAYTSINIAKRYVDESLSIDVSDMSCKDFMKIKSTLYGKVIIMLKSTFDIEAITDMLTNSQSVEPVTWIGKINNVNSASVYLNLNYPEYIAFRENYMSTDERRANYAISDMAMHTPSCPVDVPYKHQLDVLNPSHSAKRELEVFLTLLRLIARLCYPVYRADDCALDAMIKMPTHLAIKPVPVNRIYATKPNYYLACRLYENVQNECDDGEERKVFEAVLKKNCSYYKDPGIGSFDPDDDNLKLIKAMNDDINRWPTQYEILKDCGSGMEPDILLKRLEQLERKGIIRKKNHPGKGEPVYGCTRTKYPESERLQLIHPRNLDDGICNGKIEVVDPLTCQVELI